MTDIRSEKLADLILDYSVEVQKDDRLIIQFDPVYAGYATLIGRKAREREVKVRYDPISFDPRIKRGFVERFDLKEFEEESERRKELAAWCNTRIMINCSSNENYAEGIEDFEMKVAELNKKAISPYRRVLYRPGPHGGYEVRWNIVGFPYEGGAKSADMSLEDYNNFIYDATIGNDWEKIGETMKSAKQALDGAKDVHFLVPGLTDLHLSLDGRGAYVCDGKFNMPDGEFYFGPVENSVNGHVYFQIPSKREGVSIVEGIRLEFKDGVVSSFSSRKNQKGLEETFKIDGARTLGEVGFGCNYAIQRSILDTLFDEKIGGTFHLALGESFVESPLSAGGGLNKSSIHWDLVCDLRRNERNLSEFPGGEIRVDGKIVQKDGVWQV